MNTKHLLRAALAALVLSAAVWAQDDPYAAVARFDGQQRAGLNAVRDLVVAAGTDKAKTAEIETKLVAALGTTGATDEGRQELCRFLWQVASEASVPAVAKLLTDPKTTAIGCYALIGNPSAIASKALRDALPTATGRARIDLVDTIGRRADNQGVPLLAPLASDADAELRSAALSALGRIGTPEAAKALLAVKPQDLMVANARIACAAALAKAGRRADAEAIYLALVPAGQPNPTRAAALRGLAEVKSAKALDLAIAGLKDASLPVRQVAAKLAALLPDKTTAARYRAVYKELPADAQFAVLGAFADRGDAAAGPLALDALASDDEAVRAVAMVVASAAGSADLVEPLVALGIANPGQGRAVRQTLARFRGTAADAKMLEVLAKGTPEQVAFIVAPVCDRGLRGALPTLLKLVTGEDGRVARAAIAGLPRVCQPGDLDQLAATLAAVTDEATRDNLTTAILTVARRGDSASMTKLVTESLGKFTPAQRVALIGLLPGLGTDGALAALLAATKSTDEAVRLAAVEALALDWEDARAVATLIEVAQATTDADLAATALEGAVRLAGRDEQMPGEDRVALLAKVLPLAKDADLKRAVLTQLRRCRVAAAMDLAAKLLDDPQVFLEAAGCVVNLAGEQKVGQKVLPAVKGDATTAALRKVIEQAKDDGLKAQARKLL